MTLIVQKFGGTSLRNAESLQCVLKQITKCKEDGKQIIIVVSAMGRKGDPYATDSLINLLSLYGNKINPRTKDLIMSCGEIISSSMLAHLLEVNGLESVPLTGFQAGIKTNDNFNNSEIIDIDINKIKYFIKKGKIVIVAGFQGITEKGDITTLGRGGSDTTAVMLGGYLKAERVDIFTDVDGVAIIDPRIIKNPPYIEKISYSTMYELAINGANVIHPRAVLTGKKYNIPIRVRSTFSDKLGTMISQEDINIENKFIGLCLTHNIVKVIIKKQDNMVNIDNISVNKFLELSEVYKEFNNCFKSYIKKENIDKVSIINQETILEYSEGFGIIFLYFNPKYKKLVEQGIDRIKKNLKIDEQKIFSYEDKILVITEDSKLIEYAQKIYYLFEINNQNL
jgi:aspartate kinase